MASRPMPAFLFVAACLLLSGLVMRRQIAAHPRPPVDRQADPSLGGPRQGYPRQGGFLPPSFPPGLIGLPVETNTWHVMKGVGRASVIAPIQGQLAAFGKNDAVKAVSYQRRGLFRRFTPDEFLDRIQEQAPAFAHCRVARFGAVWADPDRQHADVRVSVDGEDGREAEGLYEMVRQNGAYRVAGFRGGGWMPK